MVLETSFLPIRKSALNKSRAVHSHCIPMSCYRSSYTWPATCKKELLNPEVGFRVHFSRDSVLSLETVTKNGCLYGWYHC